MKRRKSDRQAIAERLEYLCEYFKNKPNDRWNYPVVAEQFEAFLVRRGWSRPTFAPGPVPASHEARKEPTMADLRATCAMTDHKPRCYCKPEVASHEAPSPKGE